MLSILFITNTSLKSQWVYQFGMLPNYPSHYYINDAAGIGRNLIPPTPGVPLDINSTPKLLIHSTNDVTNNNLTKAILRIQDVKYNESNEATMFAGSP